MPASDDSSNEESVDETPGVCLTRSGRVSQPHDHTKIFFEAAHFQQDEPSSNGFHLKLCFGDGHDWTRKLGKGVFHKSLCFSEDVKTSKGNAMIEENVIKRWDDIAQCDFHREALGWLGCQATEIDQFCFKSTQINMQRGMKLHGDKVIESAIKKIKNLKIKHPYFGEINIDLVASEMKAKALPLLILMVSKQNSYLKTLGISNESYHRICTNKSEFCSAAPNHYSFKHDCGTIAKEKRDALTVDFLGFFDQTKRKDKALLLFNLMGVLCLLLVESNPDKSKCSW